MLSVYRAGVGFANACITLPDNSRAAAEIPPGLTGRREGAGIPLWAKNERKKKTPERPKETKIRNESADNGDEELAKRERQ